MTTAEIAAIITEMQEYAHMAEEAQAAADTLKDQIKAIMGDSESLTAGPWKITWKPVTTSRIDGKALKNDHPDIAAEYTRTTTTRRFQVA